jgi:hypothetical protein
MGDSAHRGSFRAAEGGVTMRGYMVALALVVSGLTFAAPAGAQPAEGSTAPGAAEDSGETSEQPLTAETIIEVARERLRPPGVRRPCKLPDNPDEIVVCARDPDAIRVESPTDRAIAEGQPGRDSVPRAPNVDGPGIFQGKGMKLGQAPEPPLIVDLTNEPTPLNEEDAALVYRVEDGPPRETLPEPGARP